MERVPLRPVRLHRGDPGGRAEEAVQRQDQATVHQSQNLKLNTDLTDVYFSLKDAQTIATCTQDILSVTLRLMVPCTNSTCIRA